MWGRIGLRVGPERKGANSKREYSINITTSLNPFVGAEPTPIADVFASSALTVRARCGSPPPRRCLRVLARLLPPLFAIF